MSRRNIVNSGPQHFAFTKENLELAQIEIAKYPANRSASAVIALLNLAQKQSGEWLPKASMDYVAQMLKMPRIKVYEIATFYTMFNLTPTGKYIIRVCRTTPCWLKGSQECLEACKEKLMIQPGENTQDGKFTLLEVECLGACIDAPVMQINETNFANMTTKKIHKIINQLDTLNTDQSIEEQLKQLSNKYS